MGTGQGHQGPLLEASPGEDTDESNDLPYL